MDTSHSPREPKTRKLNVPGAAEKARSTGKSGGMGESKPSAPVAFARYLNSPQMFIAKVNMVALAFGKYKMDKCLFDRTTEL